MPPQPDLERVLGRKGVALLWGLGAWATLRLALALRAEQCVAVSPSSSPRSTTHAHPAAPPPTGWPARRTFLLPRRWLLIFYFNSWELGPGCCQDPSALLYMHYYHPEQIVEGTYNGILWRRCIKRQRESGCASERPRAKITVYLLQHSQRDLREKTSPALH